MTAVTTTGHPDPNFDLAEWLDYYDDVNRRRAQIERAIERANHARAALAPLVDERRTQIDNQSKKNLAKIAAVQATEAVNILNGLLEKARQELAAIREEVLPPTE